MGRRLEDIEHNRQVLADPERCKRIAQLYAAGVTTEGILKRFEISRATLERILKDAKVPRRARTFEWATAGDAP